MILYYDNDVSMIGCRVYSSCPEIKKDNGLVSFSYTNNDSENIPNQHLCCKIYPTNTFLSRLFKSATSFSFRTFSKCCLRIVSVSFLVCKMILSTSASMSIYHTCGKYRQMYTCTMILSTSASTSIYHTHIMMGKCI